jgi:hypothetical protein
MTGHEYRIKAEMRTTEGGHRMLKVDNNKTQEQ